MEIGSHILAAAISGTLAFGGAWKLQDLRFDSKEKARLEDAREATKLKEKTISIASTSYETKKEAVRIKYVRTVQVVDRIVDRPVYKNVCLDEDGLAAINSGMVP